jgi:uncharacterized protein
MSSTTTLPTSSDLVQISPGLSYKPSMFNAHTRADDGSILLYNSLRGAHCAIPAKHEALGNKYLSAKGYTGPLEAMGQYLLQHGFIVEKTTDERGKWDVFYGLQQYRRDVFQLILLASEECNFRCVYCSQKFERGTMEPSVRAGVLKMVEARAPKLTNLDISWFGGEPLMGYEAIADLAPKLKAIADTHHLAYHSSMTTNAYLLTPERAEQLLEWGITDYQITVDGAAEDHDQHRPLAGGGSTYQTIIDNLVFMKSLDRQFNISLRINYAPTNIGGLDKFFEDCSRHFGNDQRFTIVFFPVERWGGPNDEHLDICGHNEVARVGSQLAEQAKSAGLNTRGPEDALQPNVVCYAARPYNMIVGADGKLMKCTVVLDTLKENIVGSLKDDGVPRLDYDALAKWVKPYYQDDTSCKKCFFLPSCHGASCPLPRITTGSRPCPSAKHSIQPALKAVWKHRGETVKRRTLERALDKPTVVGRTH